MGEPGRWAAVAARAPWAPAALRVLGEAGLLAAAALDALTTSAGERVESWGALAAGVALLGLLLRRRLPAVGFLMALPALSLSFALVPALVALYQLSRRAEHQRLSLVAGAVTAALAALPTPPVPRELLALASQSPRDLLLDLVYGSLAGAAPVALGRLARAREELRHQLVALDAAHCAERELREARALERERLRLAREMHDVVSHQVSLIAVQAGALQVTARDEVVRTSASTIRELGVATLEELRHMVGVLRAPRPGQAPSEPQPRLRDLRHLVEASGCGASLELDDGLVLEPPVERAVYRTVQEGLTNARKHAPGAAVAVRVGVRAAGRGSREGAEGPEGPEGPELEVVVANGPRAGRPLGLPSSQMGLVGLRERADLLGGDLEAGADGEGGYRLRLRVPLGGC